MTKADIEWPPLPEPAAVIHGIRVWTIESMSAYETAVKAALQRRGEPVDPPGDNFGSAEHWKEKAQYWADEVHKLRQQAQRGCPESDKWNCKYCLRVNSCPVKHLRDAQPAAMKPSTEQELRAFLYDATGHGKKKLRQIVTVATKMIDEADDYWGEIDAEYEMGRAPRPKGYWKRKDE